MSGGPIDQLVTSRRSGTFKISPTVKVRMVLQDMIFYFRKGEPKKQLCDQDMAYWTIGMDLPMFDA